MTKKSFLYIFLFAFLFINCGTRSSSNVEQSTETTELSATHDYGVVINSIRWATRNVDAPGTFANNPEDAGMLFQWNRIKGWNVVDREVEGWDSTLAGGTKWYAENDPCPEDWRVPTIDELNTLLYIDSEFISHNSVRGRVFTYYGLFLPAAGRRDDIPYEFVARHPPGVLYLEGYWGFYWSSTPASSLYNMQNDNKNARELAFNSSHFNTDWSHSKRNLGLSVRCVAK